MADHLSGPNDDSPSDGKTGEEIDWSNDEIEQAYQQAVRAVEAAEREVHQSWTPAASRSRDAALDAPASGPALPHSQAAGGESRRPDVTPQQIIEAALFVGGTPLTVKKLCWLLRDEFDRNFVEETIDDLGARYAREGRPYEIVFGQGGYRLALRSEFERVRNRTFGLGPKEVKLSQEALEVLALVAYRQPVTSKQIEAAGKPNPGATLRQLLRRQLIAIQREGASRQDVKYHTTGRFLEVFGLRSLDELPQSEEDFEFK